MNLEPKARRFVDLLDNSGVPAMSSGTPDAARALARSMISGRPKRPLSRVEDHLIETASGAVNARLCCDVADPLAVILYFHGGGWVIGGIDEGDDFSRELASVTACAVVSVGYRLAPEAPFPAGLDDCYAALVWTGKNRGNLFGRNLPIILLGDSAGGNLATVTAALAGDRNGPAVALQVLAYPITDAGLDTPTYSEFADGPLLTRELMAWFWDHYLPDREQRFDRLASPLRSASLAGTPPAFVLTAENDPLRHEGEAYAEALREAGVAIRAKRYDGQIHGFLTMVGMFDGTETALRDIAAFIRENLAAARENPPPAARQAEDVR